MRSTICYISLIVSSLVMMGCGQSGALHLPNDPNYDKRAKYLLYKNAEPVAQQQNAEQKNDASVSQQFPAPTTSDSTQTP
jgi:predicted small lipoprotein YifL